MSLQSSAASQTGDSNSIVSLETDGTISIDTRAVQSFLWGGDSAVTTYQQALSTSEAARLGLTEQLTSARLDVLAFLKKMCEALESFWRAISSVGELWVSMKLAVNMMLICLPRAQISDL